MTNTTYTTADRYSLIDRNLDKVAEALTDLASTFSSLAEGNYYSSGQMWARHADLARQADLLIAKIQSERSEAYD